MSKHLQRDIDLLEQQLLKMSSMVEQLLLSACWAVRQRDVSHLPDIFQQEAAIDQQEVRIEEECLKILALHQPVAGDLRRVTTILKVNGELERIADLGVNVGERTIALSECLDFPLPGSMQQLSNVAVQQVRAALDSLVLQDIDAARRVIGRDDEVDALNREVIEQLQAEMREKPAWIEVAMHCFSASRHIERIADHATNIAEDVLYMVEGDIVRHKHEQFPS